MPELRPREATDDIHGLLDALPPEIRARVLSIPPDKDVIEVVMDLGRRPEARFGGGGEEILLEREIDENDIQYVVDHIGSFGDDNRAGIERTLHRISAIRNRSGKIVGLTCRIGRAVFGTIEVINDLVESGRSVLIMGRPGVGKTTMLRESARVLAEELDKRVVIVDTSNEIAGDGDIPHPGIGRARRMQVATPNLQHAVMIEAVENHMPEVVVIDEIGTELEAAAARTIAERGVQLIGTAHGNSLENLMLNPTLSDLIGGIQTVTLGDEEARRRRTQKSVLERKAPPTFDVIVEIQDRERVMVHTDVAETVDGMLRGDAIAPELRWRDEAGVHKTQQRLRPGPNTQLPGERFQGQVGTGGGGWRGDQGFRPDLAGRFDNAPMDDRGRGGFRQGASGGWRTPRRGGRSGGVRSARDPRGAEPSGGPYGLAGDPYRDSLGAPFRAGQLADRGPVERDAPPPPGPSARDVRELTRQREWRDAAARVMSGSADPLAAATSPATDAVNSIAPSHGVGAVARGAGERIGDPTSARARERAEREAAARETLPVDLATMAEVDDAWLSPDPVDAEDGFVDDEDDEDEVADAADDADEDEGEEEEDGREVIAVRPLAPPSESLPTIRVLPFAVSRKKLETAIRELQLPVAVVREIESADMVMTLRSAYRQKAPALREAEDRAIPIYVLKSNTTSQMEASLVSLYSLEVDPREAALRETEEAIGIVLREAKAVELSPQNAYVRRIQHEMAERANLVSRSRGREPYRRVRVYPDPVRVWR